MHAFVEISGLNIYLQITVTVFSILILVFRTHKKERKKA